jgi:hypothetical protein
MARPAFIARALVLAVLALAPLLAMTTGAGIHPGYVARDATPVEPVDVAAVAHPESVFTIGSAAEQLAIQVAKTTWNADPCGGQVTVEWGTLGDDINAQSSWSNPQSAYDNPELNGSCKVTFNPGADFDWPKFCTVMVHEYGHLAGKPHSPDDRDVMAPYYTIPLQACVNSTPAEFVPAPAPAAQTQTKVASVRSKAKTAVKKKTVKRTKARKATRKHKATKKHPRAKKHRAARKHRTR